MPNSRNKRGPDTLFFATVALAAAASIYFFFQHEINTHFAYLFSDEYDAVIEAVLVSHWHHVIALAQPWREPLYFYPHQDVLGYNDSYLLYGLIGSGYRAAGFNIFVAQELVHITVKIIGFVSMVLLLNRLHGRSIINALGAALFTLAINSSVQAGHGQLLAIAFAPLLGLLLLGVAQGIAARRPKATLIYGFALIGLFNSLLLTAYYPTWFFGLFVIGFCVLHAVLARDVTKSFLRSLLYLKWHVLILAAFFVLTITPFLYVYLPKLHQTHGWSYRAQLSYSLHLPDLLNYGPGSLVWGWLARSLGTAFPSLFRPGEYRVGFTPDVLLVLALGIRHIFVARAPELPQWTMILALATLAGLMAPISIGTVSWWFFVHLLVPGSAGVRVTARYYIFLTFPIVVLISFYLVRLERHGRSAKVTGILLMLLLCASQINRSPPTYLDVARELAIRNAVSPPPAGCTSFVVSNPAQPPTTHFDKLYRQNVQAMLIADKINLPTLNGFASINPPDWAFTQDDGYLQRVADYVSRHHLTGVCRYDLTRNKWYTSISGGEPS